MARQLTLAELQAEIRRCCSDMAAADKLALDTRKRLDRLVLNFAGFRREMRSVNATFRRWLEQLELRK